MSPSHQKCALLIIDGLGDVPVPELGGRTPLEAAHTPVLDRLAGSGLHGLVDPIGPGEIPNTHSGASLLLGVAREHIDRLHRGPVEIMGAGHPLQTGEIALRANLATLEGNEQALSVIDRRAGRISSGTGEFAELLSDIDLGDGIRARFYPTDQHRGAVLLSGPGLNPKVSDTDPGSTPLPAPLDPCRPLEPDAEFTADKINQLMDIAHRILKDHPLNRARLAAGKLPANGLLLRGSGGRSRVLNVLDELGLSTAVVSGCNTIRGLARMFAFDSIYDPRFTATFDTDLHAKIKAVVSALNDHDLVYLHVKAPDICAHDLKPLAKRDFLERLDQSLAPLAAANCVIAVAADHTTDSNTGFHTADPVPALLFDPSEDTANQGSAVVFGESACRGGSMPRQTSAAFLRRTLETMGIEVWRVDRASVSETPM